MYRLRLNKLKKPEAFLGKITQKVRKVALDLASRSRGKILDVGCGNCLLLLELIKRYQLKEKMLFGIDLNLDLLLEARELAKDNRMDSPNILCGNGVLLPFKSNTFDHTLCINTFINLNLSTVEEIVKELGRVTKPEGYIIVDIRNKNNLLLKLRYFLKKFKNPIKIQAYTLDELLPCLKKNNMKVTKVINIRIFPFLTVARVLIIKNEGLKS